MKLYTLHLNGKGFTSASYPTALTLVNIFSCCSISFAISAGTHFSRRYLVESADMYKTAVVYMPPYPV